MCVFVFASYDVSHHMSHHIKLDAVRNGRTYLSYSMSSEREPVWEFSFPCLT